MSPANTKRSRTWEDRAIDRHVGARLKLRRTLLGLSQTALGDKAGVTFQQILKYERGIHSIAAGRLYVLAQFLDVPVSFFFEGLRSRQEARRPESERIDMLDSPETLELVRCYYEISDPKTRKSVFKLVKELAKALERS